MNRMIHFGLAVLLAWVLTAAPATARAKVLASVGNDKITEEEFNGKVKESETKQGRALSREEKTTLLKMLLNQRLLVAEARARGLEKDTQVKQAVADGTRLVLANTLFDREVASKVRLGEDEIKAFYDANPQALEIARASHILIKPSATLADDAARKKAEDIYRRVKGNPSLFAEEARKSSEDAVSRERGGDLGAFGRGAMVKEVDKAVFEAKAGDFLPPVKTQFGYHVIYLVEKRLPSLEEAHAVIAQELSRRKTADLQADFLNKLNKKYHGKVSEDSIP